MFDAVLKNTVVPLILRLGLAAIFIYHGLDLVSQENEWGAAWMTRAMEKQKEKEKEAKQESQGESSEPEAKAPPAPVQVLVAWGQLIGGIAMVLGFLTRLAALGLAIIMGGATALVHWPHGFDSRAGGYEYNFLIIVVCLALMLVGGGNLGVDRVFRLRRKQS
jgi:uncharacterized membrane protein YphA (DoxX/SURF4 family)